MKIVWSDVAEADLDDLYDYIARDVPYYAEQFVDRLIEAVGVLKDHPRLGRRVPEAKEREDDEADLPELPNHLPRRSRTGYI
jgi:plasmid stabilization system protein ParE